METQISYDNSRRLAALLSYGLFPSPMDPTLFAGAGSGDWRDIYATAAAQAAAPLAFRGVMSLPTSLRPDERLMSEWKSSATRSSLTGEWMIKLQAKLLGCLGGAGIPALVIKGADMCALYPKPELRPLGGIELLVDENRYQDAVRALLHDGCTLTGEPGAYRAELMRNGTKTAVCTRPLAAREGAAAAAIDNYMTGTMTSGETVRLYGTEFRVMDAERRCVMLLAHAGDRLCDGGAGLRVLCDWAMLVRATPEPDRWERLFSTILPAAGLANLAIYLTACAQRYLELDVCPWSVSVSSDGVERLFSELVSPAADSKDGDDKAVLYTSGIAVDGDADRLGSKKSLSDIFRSLTGKKQPIPVSGARVDKKRRRAIVSELRLFEPQTRR